MDVKLKKRKPFHFVPVTSLGDCTEGSVDLAIELEPIHEDLHNDSAALVLAFQVGSRRRQPRVESAGHLAADAELGVQGDVWPELGLGCPDAQVCIVGDFQRAAARTLGEAALGQCLDAPGDPPKQELFVIRSGLLAEHLKVLLAELADCHPAQLINLFPHRGLHFVLHSHGR